MFSVIIPVYNKAGYIKKCIDSVIDQTFSEFELIIIDDGSTDDSLAIIRQFSDPRIKYKVQKNAGVSATRNNGVKIAKYDNVAFLDADDWWHPDFLEEADKLVRAYPAADLYGTNYYYVKNGKQRVEYKGLPSTFHAGYIDYVSVYATSFCALINCSFVIVRKDAFLREEGFRSTLRFGEDFDLWIRLALHGNVAYLNKPLAFSNQDVEVTNRAIGGHILYPPTVHFVFNLSYLYPHERTSARLKTLLDGLRVRSLLPYYISGQYGREVKRVVADVDFDRQPRYFRWLYTMPVQMIRVYFASKRIGSTCKQWLLQLAR
ncbi:glycosyltransferase [Nostoc sp. CHAB 5834]|nr:glycosyltransferase [Nostoc sp. CHAB 5834]